jgi:hypothetical protein
MWQAYGTLDFGTSGEVSCVDRKGCSVSSTEHELSLGICLNEEEDPLSELMVDGSPP